MLAALTPYIEHAGRQTAVVALHDRQRRLPLDLQNDPRLQPPAVLIVDGYEQLSGWSRLMLKRFCRRRGVGLLVTAHDSVGFSPLYRTVATPQLAVQIVAALLGGRQSPFTPEEVSRQLCRNGTAICAKRCSICTIFTSGDVRPRAKT